MLKPILIISLLILFSISALCSELTGQSFRYSYENGNVYEVCFMSDSKLFWKAIAGDEIGASNSETYTYKMIDSSIHQVGWVEETGFTVSQVLNFKSLEVNSHLIFVETPGQNPTLLQVSGIIKKLQGICSTQSP